MKARTFLGTIAGLTLVLAAALPAIAGTTTPTNIIATTTPATYTVTDLGIPGIGVDGENGDPSQPPPPTINSSGAVAGSYATSTSFGAFLWRNGVFTDLGSLGGCCSKGFTINNNGQIVGWSFYSPTPPCNTENAFLWQTGTGMTNLEDHPSTCGWISEAHGINTAGVTVGLGQRNQGYTQPLVFSGGGVSLLPTPCCPLFNTPSRGGAEAINDAGQIVGWGPEVRADGGPGADTPLLWQGSTYTVLGSLGGLDGNGEPNGRALAVNAAGQVIGWSLAPDSTPSKPERHAFLWQNGTMTDLGTLQGTDSIAYGINSSGVVVGHSVDVCPGAPCGPSTAFIYENGVMLDLNNLIPAGSGVHLRSAGGINDSGQIVAVSDTPNAHAFLLTPVTVVKADTTTTITSDTPDPSVVGQPYTVSWTVTVNAPGSGTPTGSVTVSDGTGATCQAAVATGSCSLTSASAGTKTLTATYSGDGNFNGSSASTTHQVDAADMTPPMVTCGSGDAVWHAANVSIACTASDSGSGLANPGDASFSLSTSVPAGTEDANALTDSRQVCDNAGNCTTVGPIGASKIDRKAPVVALNMPANGATYLLRQPVTAGYSCSDGGSGVASCAGTVASGTSIDTGSVGTKTFSVTGTDAVGNSATRTVSYTVSYAVKLNYDPTKPTNTIDLLLQDATGANVSSASIVLTATSIDNAIPQSGTFTFSKSMKSYKYALPKGLSSGPHTLYFTAQGDPATHTAPFRTR